MRDLIFVALALFAWGLGEGMFFIFQPLYLEKLGASTITIGAILGASGAVMVLVHLPAGHLADRIGRRPLMRAAWMMGTLSTITMALAPSLRIFAAALVAYSLTAFVIAPLNSYITAARGRLSVSRVLTLISVAYNLGAIAGPIAGGLIAGALGLRSIYQFAAGLFLLSTIFMFFARPQPVEPAPERGNSLRLLLNRPFSMYLGVVFLVIFSTYLSQPLSSIYLQDRHNLGFEQIGQLGSLTSLGVVVMNLVLGQLDARIGFLLAQLAAGLFAMILWKGSGMPLLGAGYFLLGGFRTVRAFAIAQARDYIPASQMGLGYGLVESLGGLVVLLAPPLAGYLYSRNPTWMFSAGVGLTTLTMMISVWFLLLRRPPSLPPAAIEIEKPGI